MKLSKRSETNLQGVNPRLVLIVRRAALSMDFVVTEGLRTLARQTQLVAAGASFTMNSRHLTGDAVDLAAVVNGEIRWDWPLYGKLAEVMKPVIDEDEDDAEDQIIFWNNYTPKQRMELEQAFEERHNWLGELQVEPAWDNLRDVTRFQNLVHQVGFTK